MKSVFTYVLRFMFYALASMDTQTLIVLTLIVVAALYVGRGLWPSRRSQTGCRSCPQNRNRVDDYM